MKIDARTAAFSSSRGFLFVGGGLGDVARRFYMSDTYELLKGFREPTAVICYSHNPAALDFFRFHPNHRNLVLIDMGHIYMALLRDHRFDKRLINERLFAICGFLNGDLLARNRAPRPIGSFFAPDTLSDAQGHVVIHPFGRGWGDWPPETMEALKNALRFVPESVQVFVVCADYIAADGQAKRESFVCDQPNVRVLNNLSAPAVFSLVASASRFIGSMSALAQVAAFEKVPSIVLHPARCSDFNPPYSDYAKTIWRANGIGIPYDSTFPSIVAETLKRFFQDPQSNLNLREDFKDLAAIPDF